MSRILAVDYGSKRLGLALSDETKKISFPIPYLSVEKKEQIIDLIRNQEVDLIILGMPKSLDNKETKSAQDVREFAEWLKQKINVPIKFADERFSTKEAMHRIHAKDLKGRKARSEIDSLVAQRMLEMYLEKFRN